MLLKQDMSTKMFLFVIGLVVLTFLVLPKSKAQETAWPRFELLSKQYHAVGDNNPWASIFKVYHDRETGQEVVCVTVDRGGGCYLTGRNWK